MKADGDTENYGANVANGIDIKMDLPSDGELRRMFDMVPKLEAFKVLDKAVDAASKPVVKRARELAPRDTKGHGKKRSYRQKNAVGARGDKIDWDYPLWKTIKRVVRKYQNRYGVAVIGPEWPKGNKAYFNTSPKGNKGHLWGKHGQSYPRRDGKGNHIAGPPKARAQVRNWIVQAFDETRNAQLDAMKASVTKSIDEVMRG